MSSDNGNGMMKHTSGVETPDAFVALDAGDKSPAYQMNAAPVLTLAEVRKQLDGKKGKRYWQSIDELAGTPEFEAAVVKEFPDQAQEWVDPVSRRGFLK